MKQIIQLTLHKKSLESGFTLLEVLVGVLIITFFVLGSMQALVLGTSLRVDAQAKQRADQLIQEDVEEVKYGALNLAANHSFCTATAVDSSGDDDVTIDSFAESLYYSLPPVPTPKNLIADNLNSPSYTLTRTINETISTPKRLRIDYTVTASNNREVESNTNNYVEVIPNVATKCP